MRFEVTVLADDGDAEDSGQLELGTMEVTADTERAATEAAHEALWDARLNMTSFPRYRVRKLSASAGLIQSERV